MSDKPTIESDITQILTMKNQRIAELEAEVERLKGREERLVALLRTYRMDTVEQDLENA